MTFGRLTEEEAADAKLEAVVVSAPRYQMQAPLLARRLVNALPDKAVIVSFIDSNVQQALESIARNSTHLIPERASMAMMVMEHETGKVVGYVGSQTCWTGNVLAMSIWLLLNVRLDRHSSHLFTASRSIAASFTVKVC